MSLPVRRFWTGKLTHAAHQLAHSLPRGVELFHGFGITHLEASQPAMAHT